ncbi:redoxin domain-containing protein [Alphaproteobacteria bacterium GH1-50]|uniref:Redoxin domain-containing protein n=1 Tax=Kangsaoukella pontilimi TaxID=2691042 RepID=A0A7C9MYQ5_9RHOB|nr:redoxin domain-containing protein [Kangsaoukella pontilimi]MXQ06938.1 redoxin domain-containing protein [Kangsaoukella pontilimi]
MPRTPLPGQTAPDLHLPLIIGSKWTLAEQSPGAFTMIVVYRGLHCPMCEKYLKQIRAMYDEFLAKGVEVLHVSMDGKDRATKAHEDWALDPIPMAYGLTEDQAADWGLYLSKSMKEAEPDVFAEPGLFLVRGTGELYLVDISNSPFSRPDLTVLLDKLDFIIEKDYPARGTKAA